MSRASLPCVETPALACEPRPVRHFGLLVSMLLLASPTVAQRLPHVQQPAHYRSPSGLFDLHVRPSTRAGDGPAECTLRRGGVVVWTAEKPYTLFEAAVTDEGVVAGYAYSTGLVGRHGAPGDLRALILDASGAERLDEATPRQVSRLLHASPEPEAAGLFVDQQNDRFVLRVRSTGSNGESWSVYRLKSGKKGPSVQLPASDGWVAAARPVPGTPLTLVHRIVAATGASFSLLDLQAQEVWSVRWPNDYGANAEAAAVTLVEVRTRGAVLDVRRGAFDLRSYAPGESVTFTVAVEKAAPGGWAVRETVRTPVRPAAPAISSRPLTLLGTFPVGPRPGPADGHVFGFDFDDRGRLGVLRRVGYEKFALGLLAATGRSLAEIPLNLGEIDKADGAPAVLWVDADRWLVYRSRLGVGGAARAFWVNVANRQVAPVVGFDCPPIDAAARFGRGGFVVLATTRSAYTMTTDAIAFDAVGTRRWVTPERALFSPADLAVTTAGEVAVISSVGRDLRFIGPTGTVVRALPLEQAWGRRPNYLSEIVADHSGGFVVLDFKGTPPLVWMKGDGTVVRAFDGSGVRSLRIDPDDQLWGLRDGQVVRLTATGQIDRTIGAAPRPAALGGDVSVDARSRLHLVDPRTGAALVIGPDGKQVAGDAQVERRTQPTTSFKEPRRWFPRPGRDGFWVSGYERLGLLAEDGAVKQLVERWPDETWVDMTLAASVANDGSLAAVNHAAVHLFDAAGSPVRSIALPAGTQSSSVAWDGARVAVGTPDSVIVVGATGEGAFRFTPPATQLEGGNSRVLLVGGNELWLLAPEQKTVVRYALPGPATKP